MTDPRGRGHERRDLSLRLVVAFAVALVVFCAGSHYLLRAVFSGFGTREDRRAAPAPPLRASRVEPPPPRLQADPALDLGALRAREERELSSYGWVDRDRGTVRIPIDRAMKRVAERGLPARSAPRTAD